MIFIFILLDIMKERIILFLFLALASLKINAQFSKTHYIPPITRESNDEEYFLYISTPTSSNVNFKIIEIGGSVISGTVNNNNPYIYNGNSVNSSQLFIDNSQIGIVSNKGYIIEAEDLVYVSLRINIDQNNNGYLQGGGIVSKGNSALGTQFRLGAMINPIYHPKFLNFASILSTENDTKITISNIADGTILTDGTVINGPINITLNKNESYVIAMKNFDDGTIGNSNSSNLIGALVSSNKSVAVTTGSYEGSNSSAVNNQGNASGRDVGFDQIVPFTKTGSEYIFVKGNGTDDLEQVLLIAHKNNTEVFLNGNNSAYTTLNSGEYILIDGSEFINGNLFVSTSENVFAYQSISGTGAARNQNMFFVPPLNCATPNIVDNIPFAESIGNISFNGSINIIAETGEPVTLNNQSIGSAISITGNPDYVRYSIDNLSGSIAVESTGQVYVSYFGNNGAATYGGYYSGFDTKPEIVTERIAGSASSCLPNVTLKISSFSSYDTFEWYFNDKIIPGATSNTYIPTQPGYYQVKGKISDCKEGSLSDVIPVSLCPEDTDEDGTNNNLDIDLDNDGIINSVEAAPQFLNHSDPEGGSNFNGIISGTGSITGKPNYGFSSQVPADMENHLTYTLNFPKPKIVTLEYIATNVPNISASEYLNYEGDFIIRVPPDKTITLQDPLDQLVVDTNYDGIYESGVTEFSSFEIRFRLKSTIPLNPGAGKFSFSSYLTNSITLVHKNLSETHSNAATFMVNILNTRDSDSDNIPDLLDVDSDNDGITDTLEAQGKDKLSFSGSDSNHDGLDNAFEPGLNPINSDNDQHPDYLDLDSDNDGIFDLLEANRDNSDTNKDGILDGSISDFGSNGLLNKIESSTDSGKLAKYPSDSDSDSLFDYIEIDSDDDGCYDVIEAGFTDDDGNGTLGTAPDSTDNFGRVTQTQDGYTTPLDIDSNGIYDFQEDNLLSAGTSNEITICSSDDIIDLFEYLGDADRGGNWDKTTINGDGLLDPASDEEGIYTYTVVNPTCGNQSAEIKVTIEQSPNAGTGTTVSFCTSAEPIDLFSLLEGDPDTNGSWTPQLSNGIFDPATDEPGSYVYQVDSEFCDPATSEIKVTVDEAPDAGENNSIKLCINELPVNLFENLQGNPQTGGTWTPQTASGNGILDPSSDPEGTYTYTISNALCGEDVATIMVTYETPYAITNYEINTEEFSDNNSIEIIITDDGFYEYSLDESTFQEDNKFGNLAGGEYNIYAREINGCGFLQETAIILDYPKFFSPNNDGYNDLWRIQGSEKEYTIKIFDRYGKLLKTLATNQGWDGIFNGKRLPSDDYWFEFSLIDGTVKTGHFSLIR